MKQLTLLIITILLTNLIFSQNLESIKSKTDSITDKLEQIDLEILNLKEQRNSLRNQLTVLNSNKNKLELEQELLEGIKVKISAFGGVLRDKPNISGNTIVKIPSNETILVYNWYEKPYFKAVYKEKVGYISYSSLEKNERINSLVNKDLAEKNPKLANLIKRFGSRNAERIYKGEYWIGMTDVMARKSIGYPDDVNKSTGSWGVHEQWVYDKTKLYLYFENGKLSSIQN